MKLLDLDAILGSKAPTLMPIKISPPPVTLRSSAEGISGWPHQYDARHDESHVLADGVDAERLAIQWAECGNTADLDAALRQAIGEWRELTQGPTDDDANCGRRLPECFPHPRDKQVDVPRCLAAYSPAPAIKRARRLIGIQFLAIASTIPPASIVETPKARCPSCGADRVLPELREMTGGRCWECNWTKSHDRILSPLD